MESKVALGNLRYNTYKQNTILPEIEINIKTLSRLEKFRLIQLLAMELAQEEQELSQYFKADEQHGLWSQYNAFEAAQKLETLLSVALFSLHSNKKYGS